MKAKRNSLFPAAISAVYIVTVLLFVFSLLIEYKKGASESQGRFNAITKDISRISGNYAPQSKKFYDELLASLGNISDIAGMQLKYGEELIFSYPRKISELENINASLVNTYTTAIFSRNGIPVSLTASIYLLRPSSIFYKGRIAFAAVLIATVAAAIYLAVLVRNGTFPGEAESDEPEEDEIEYPEISLYHDLPQEQDEPEPEPDNGSEAEAGEQPQETVPGPEKTEEEEDVLAFLNEGKEETAEEPAAEDAENSPDSTDDRQNPSGLFCPDTGFGWEQYMLPRLDSELVRSASSDQDLALLTLRISGVSWKSECGKELSKTILETVKFNDLVFNYKNDGASAIFQNQNTDKSLVCAEELHSKLVSVISRFGMNIPVAIGISTRSLRLISGARLANESEEALGRAMADEDSPIIAFRVNPDRYKNFLASESFQEQEQPQPGETES